ncbi:hypothetical protein MLD38_002060 [Melastoma candidum]|uniref:Uncharacterized protein n=1 Tax=Melastoma candidum TaxID=119954 RepID=A0ACB9SFB4_9MYRT|nr:hypothetical protein MLD38_002060 [Melastoma candidum]
METRKKIKADQALSEIFLFRSCSCDQTKSHLPPSDLTDESSMHKKVLHYRLFRSDPLPGMSVYVDDRRVPCHVKLSLHRHAGGIGLMLVLVEKKDIAGLIRRDLSDIRSVGLAIAIFKFMCG